MREIQAKRKQIDKQIADLVDLMKKVHTNAAEGEGSPETEQRISNLLMMAQRTRDRLDRLATADTPRMQTDSAMEAVVLELEASYRKALAHMAGKWPRA